MKTTLTRSTAHWLICSASIICCTTSRLSADEPLTQEAISKNVAKVVERIRSFGPVEPENDNQMDIYLLDVDTGKIEVAFDDPSLELGTPFWSHDGLRILFDATPGRKWNRTQFAMLDASEDDAKVTMHGFGNCPTISPDGKQVSYRLNHDALPDVEPGVWVMDLDGAEMHPLGIIGYPRWSPDGDAILISRNGGPTSLCLQPHNDPVITLLNLRNCGCSFESNPYWVGDENTIVATIEGVDPGAEIGVGETCIALIDISQPEACRIKRILWKQGDGLDVRILSPLFSPTSGKCVFSGRTEDGYQLFLLDDKQEGPPQAIKLCGPVSYLDELTMSPDGRYVLFCSNLEFRELLKQQSE
ncbi:MAG: PD40 domain-containing protein [Planctomycetaceae bacterium]|nr:PD40 domain-containing protein [Planctomycetaceae bacterium]